MRIVLIADVFPPLRSSGAVQLRDLSQEFARQGHDVTVLVPDHEIGEGWRIEMWNGVRVVRLRSPKAKDVAYVRRTIAELLMPFTMLYNLHSSPLANERWEGVVWYSPTIFLGPIAKALKKMSNCRSYLVIRDIFPEWTVNMGLMGRGLPYRFFKMIERYQYSVADVIGVQTPANLDYFEGWGCRPNHRVEVLQNWLAEAQASGCRISLDCTPLAGRKIFIYAGNMGIAQGMDVLLDLAECLRSRADIGFLFVGRGSEAHRLRAEVAARTLGNVVFFDEVEPSEIPDLYAQCHIGLVALDPRHRTHNIPGKFLSYIQAGLPVLASINPGNDLAALIDEAQVGYTVCNGDVATLQEYALKLVEDIGRDAEIGYRCKTLSTRLFSPEAAVRQIIQSLQSDII